MLPSLDRITNVRAKINQTIHKQESTMMSQSIIQRTGSFGRCLVAILLTSHHKYDLTNQQN